MYGLMKCVLVLWVRELILGLALEPLYEVWSKGLRIIVREVPALFGFVQVMKYGRKHQM
tara:strand:+ start:234 stop:410 length:177 start_codon:yes stop_codon:yes gene_type:complete